VNPTETLASYVAEARFDDFPKEVVWQAKQCILDSIGCALGCAQTEHFVASGMPKDKIRYFILRPRWTLRD